MLALVARPRDDFEDFCRKLGECYAELRVERGLTQEAMGRHGFSLRYYQRLEAGMPSRMRTFYELCRIFDVAPSSVLLMAEKRQARQKR